MKRIPPFARTLFPAAALLCLTAFWLFGTRHKLGRDNWHITPNPLAWPAGAWLLPIGVLFIFGGLAAVSAYDRFKRANSRKSQKASTAISLGALCLLAIFWPASLLGPTLTGTSGVANLVQAHWSDVANGYFGAAYEIEDPRQFTGEYPRQSQTADSPTKAHVATHPPGAVLWYYGARRVFENSPRLQNTFSGVARWLGHEDIDTVAAQSRDIVLQSSGQEVTLPTSAVPAALWCAFLIACCAALTVPAVYLLAAQSSDAESVDTNEGRGLLAAALWVFAPTVGLFAFTLDVLIACGAAWTLVFLTRRGGWAWRFAAGIVLGLTSFLSFGALAIWGICVLVVVLQRRIKDLLPMIAGFVFVWLVVMLLFPMQPLTIYRNAMAAHRAATLTSRSYGGWLLLNLVMFVLFAGWPLVVGTFRALCQLKKTSPPAWSETAITVGIAALATMLLLTLSGNVRGEVERLWLFLLAPLCALAAHALVVKTVGNEATDSSQKVNRISVVLCVVFLLLQPLQTLMMAASLAPLVRP
ncbi:MAG TPA: hypothetical protein VF719_04275 [Abditibacteriaceae bacterium]